MADQKQIIELVYVSAKAEAEARKFAAGEQARTRQNASVAAKAANETKGAVARALKEQADAAVAAYKRQVLAAQRAYDSQRFFANDAADREARLDRDRLREKTAVWRRAQDELTRIETDRLREARIATVERIRREADEFDAGQKRQQEALERTRAAANPRLQRIIDQMNAQKKATADGTTGVMALGRAFLSYQSVVEVLNQVKAAMQAVGASTQDARSHVRSLVDEMEKARTASKEIAGLTGNKPTAMFTAQQAREASEIGLTPESYQQFELSFQAYAGQYVGAEGATPEQLQAGGQRLSKEQAADLQKKVAGYSVGARGLSADDSARLLGTVVAKSRAGASNDEIMTEYAKLMKVMEMAPGRTSPLIGQLSELGMESVGEAGDFKDLQQAGYLIRAMAQRNPLEASTYGRAVLNGLREIRMDPSKMRELGITKDMDVFGQLSQIDKVVQAHTAAGGNQGELLSKYFHDVRQWGGVQTALNEGIRGGGFQRASAEAATVDSGTADKEIRGYLSGQEGRAVQGDSRVVAASRERAARQVPLRQMERDALESLISSGALEVPESMVGSVLTSHGAAFGQGSRQEQELRALVSSNLTTGLSGYKEGRDYLGSHAPLNRGSSVDEQAEAALMLDKLRRSAEKASEALEQMNGSNPAAPRPGAGAVPPALPAPQLVVPRRGP